MMKTETEFDLTSVFTKNYNLFFYFGFWKPDDNCRYKTLYNCYTFFCFSLLVVFLLPQVIYMAANGDDIMEVTGTMYVFCSFFINLIKTLGIYLNMDTIKEVLMDLKENPLLQVKRPEHLAAAKKVKKLCDYLFFYGTFLGFGTQLFWTLTPFFQSEKTLPINGWYPYDAMASPYFEITNVLQNVTNAFNIFITMNVDSFTINLMMQVGLQCDLLKLTLENLTTFRTTNGRHLREYPIKLNRRHRNFQEEMTRNLKVCVQHYVEIKRMANALQNIYRISMLVLFLGGAVILCTIFYQLLLINSSGTQFFHLMFFLFSMLTEQFIFCWFGNEITYKSERLYRAVYDIPSWTDCDPKFRKMLLIFMISLEKPIVIHAGHIIPLSTAVFLNVLQTSYSYLALLTSL